MDKLNETLCHLADVALESLGLSKYDKNTIRKIERRLGTPQYRKSFNSAQENDKNNILRMYGFPLGRCICETLNGHWIQDNQGQLVVECKGNEMIVVNPFSMISKFMEFGDEKSLTRVYQTMKLLCGKGYR